MTHVYSFESLSKKRTISDMILQKVIGKYEICLEDGDPYHNQNLNLENGCNIRL